MLAVTVGYCWLLLPCVHIDVVELENSIYLIVFCPSHISIYITIYTYMRRNRENLLILLLRFEFEIVFSCIIRQSFIILLLKIVIFRFHFVVSRILEFNKLYT